MAKAHSPSQVHHREVLTLQRTLRVLLKVRQGVCEAQVSIPTASAFLWGMDWNLSGPCSYLICGVMKMSIRISLDLEPEYEAFVKEWADKAGISPSELMRRVVHETCNGFRYEEKIPDYYPLGKRLDWKRLDRRRDRRKKREAARLN